MINPIAIPETGDLILTPASINASVPAQTVAIDEEPFDSRISETHTYRVWHLSFQEATLSLMHA